MSCSERRAEHAQRVRPRLPGRPPEGVFLEELPTPPPVPAAVPLPPTAPLGLARRFPIPRRRGPLLGASPSPASRRGHRPPGGATPATRTSGRALPLPAPPPPPPRRTHPVALLSGQPCQPVEATVTLREDRGCSGPRRTGMAVRAASMRPGPRAPACPWPGSLSHLLSPPVPGPPLLLTSHTRGADLPPKLSHVLAKFTRQPRGHRSIDARSGHTPGPRGAQTEPPSPRPCPYGCEHRYMSP